MYGGSAKERLTHRGACTRGDLYIDKPVVVKLGNHIESKSKRADFNDRKVTLDVTCGQDDVCEECQLSSPA